MIGKKQQQNQKKNKWESQVLKENETPSGKPKCCSLWFIVSYCSVM